MAHQRDKGPALGQKAKSLLGLFFGGRAQDRTTPVRRSPLQLVVAGLIGAVVVVVIVIVASVVLRAS